MESLDKEFDVSAVMSRSLECYKYIDEIGTKLHKIISEQITPLLEDGKYEEAKGMVRDFYKPSRYTLDNEEGHGDVIFIEYDMLLARINRLRTQNKA